MKLDFFGKPRSGKCYVCGKDVKLLIHADCGKKRDEQNCKIVDGRNPAKRRLSEAKAHGKAYAAGKPLPSWMTDK